MPGRRGGVVIGVNKTGGGLQALESSAAGAVAFAEWLDSEGFEVITITDLDEKGEPKKVEPNSHRRYAPNGGARHWK
jgi:hypothetical protein